MPSSRTYLCVGCREVSKLDLWNGFVPAECPRCSGSMANMGTRWRAPKRNNNKAWKLIESGDIWWDKNAIERSILKRMRKGLHHRFPTKDERIAIEARKVEAKTRRDAEHRKSCCGLPEADENARLSRTKRRRNRRI